MASRDRPGGRAVGLVLVILGVVAALVVPLHSGRRIAGTAAAVAVPAAPRVGDCVQGPGSGAESHPGAGPAATVVPCGWPHEAEVITWTDETARASPARRTRPPRPNLAACATTAYAYLGVHPLDPGGERSPVLGPWWPAFAVSFQTLAPGPLQVQLGQSWAACVMVGLHGPVAGGTAGLFARSPARRNPVPLCSPGGGVVLYLSISCQQPHAAEILGWRVSDAGIDATTTFASSCRALAGRMTGRPDPTSRGELRVGVIVLRSPDDVVREGWGPGHGGPYRAACTLSSASTRMLTGSLTGLGAAPIPWA